MNTRFRGTAGIKQPDDAGECGARIGYADRGAAFGKFMRHQKTAGLGSLSHRSCLPISDECDLVPVGRFQRGGGANFKGAVAFPSGFQMIRNF
jgi:hypothetical protein